MLRVAACCLLVSIALGLELNNTDRVWSLPVYGQLKSPNYAGYIGISGGRKMFYWFVISQSAPKTDPLVVWLTGGPGCSSLLAFSEENGPYTMRHGGNFESNEFAWSTLANILYIESPPGVGFSVDTTPPTVWDDNNTAQANYETVIGFLEKYPQFKGRKMFITGESYAGHFVPQLADAIYEGSHKLLKRMMQGFMVGNPCTGNIGCGNDDPTLNTFLTYQSFMPLNASIPTQANANYDPYDLLVLTCPTATLAKRVRFAHPVLDALKKRLGDAPFPYGACADNFVIDWFNRADVQKAIHAEPRVWQECGGVNYTINYDGVVHLYQKFMDNTKWAMLIYSGASDSIVNFVQTQTIVNSMKRPLKNPVYTAWNYPDYYHPNATQLGGFYLEFDRVSWASVRDAGHMVPQFNPPEALELFRSFLQLGRPGRL